MILPVKFLAQRAKQIQIETDIPEAMKPALGNPIAMKRAVSNLVVNALRYGNGWVKVSWG